MSNFKNALIVVLSVLLVLAVGFIYVSQPRPVSTGLNAILNINPPEAKPLLKYLKSNEKVQFKILKDECIINNNKAGLPPLSAGVKYNPDYFIKSSKNSKANCKEILKLSK